MIQISGGLTFLPGGVYPCLLKNFSHNMKAMFRFTSNMTKIKAPCRPLNIMKGYHRNDILVKVAMKPNIQVSPMIVNNFIYK